jgi:hypothetical protein
MRSVPRYHSAIRACKQVSAPVAADAVHHATVRTCTGRVLGCEGNLYDAHNEPGLLLVFLPSL